MPDKPVTLEQLRRIARPLPLDSVDGVARFLLTAANESAALIECAQWMTAPPVGRRLLLVGAEGFLQAVRMQLTVIQAVDSHRVIAKWLAISASHRASYLPKVLEHVLGIRQRVAVAADVLGAGTRVVWDASRRQVRLMGGSAQAQSGPSRQQGGQAQADSGEGYYASGRDLEAMRVHADDAPPPALEVSQRKASRLHPMFDLEPTRGYYALGEEDFFPVVVTAVGSSHCVFEVSQWQAPTLGTAMRLGVPMEPIKVGLAWVPVKVSQVSGRPPRRGAQGGLAVVEVQVDRSNPAIPREFRKMVAHHRQLAAKAKAQAKSGAGGWGQ